ncbi:MAG TPA: hypothetical protein VHN98_03060 [Acidimicrobiales bacterium]|nr:hypothetical protein [Acidimicrobiales bacterium]
MAEIAALLVGDPPALWSELGFVVDDDTVEVSGVHHVLGGDKKGIRDWSMRGLAGDIDVLDGLPFGLPAAPARPTPDHPNGVVALDHVVLATPDIARTIESIEAAGIECRRVREAGTYGAPMRQAFFRLGEVILEVVGGAEKSGDGPPRFFGLAYTVRDLDETARFLGDRLHPAKDAVQPGRRIATLDKGAGSTVPLAFMSPGLQNEG